VVELIGVHAADHTHLIRDGVEIRNRVRHPDPTRSMLGELPRSAEQLGSAAGKGEPLPFDERLGRFLARVLHEFRLVVEEIQMGRRAGHVEIDHPLHLRREVGLMRRERIRCRRRRGDHSIAREDRRQRRRADAGLAGLEEMATGDVETAVQIGHESKHLKEVRKVPPRSRKER
jgi:hypothetical protein